MEIKREIKSNARQRANYKLQLRIRRLCIAYPSYAITAAHTDSHMRTYLILATLCTDLA